MNKIGILLLLSSLLLCPQMVLADNKQNKPENWGAEQGEHIPGLSLEREEALDSAQVEASELLFKAADWIDSFFDDGRYVNEDKESRATLKLSVGYSRNDDFEVKPRADIRLKLPMLSSRAQLLISAADDSDFDIDNDPVSDRPSSEDDDEDFTAAIRFFLKESEKYNITFDSGASWNYLFAGVRFRSIQDFGEWLGRFTNRLRWYTDDGFENRATYDVETHFSKEFFFRATSSIKWYEERSGLPHSQFFRLYQVVDSLRALSYETGFYFDTEPSYKMTDTEFILKYRQRFYRDWLVLEVSPRISFPEDHDRDPNPGIIIKFEAAIGYNADEEGYRKVFK